MSSELRSATIIPVPEVAGAVEGWLERSARMKPSHGVPAHVTLLWPCPPDVEGIRTALAGFSAFGVEFRELRRFPESPTLYLAPDQSEPFVRITEALVARFPEWPPYGGLHDAIVPHLTVAQGDARDDAEAALTPLLPLGARVREAVLLSETAPQRWEQRARFPFQEA